MATQRSASGSTHSSPDKKKLPHHHQLSSILESWSISPNLHHFPWWYYVCNLKESCLVYMFVRMTLIYFYLASCTMVHFVFELWMTFTLEKYINCIHSTSIFRSAQSKAEDMLSSVKWRSLIILEKYNYFNLFCTCVTQFWWLI